jgi:predicted glycoside hydrolase/deacetylase ChbG (UPF0249 family)
MNMGLEMDHLNSHHNLHIHPTLTRLILRLAAKYSIPGIRLPLQGLRTLNRKNFFLSALTFPWAIRLKNNLVKAGIDHNQEVFGLHETGAMREEAWIRIIPTLKPGVTEIFCHPAVNVDNRVKESESISRQVDEFKALMSLRVRDLLIQEGIELISFSDISG